jgi:nucleotide sugar dehydrogenase
MKVSIVGAGYVGLVTGASLAKAGHHVMLIERRAEVVERIRRGECPFFEPGLPELLSKVQKSGTLVVTEDLAEGVAKSEITLLCVGTPSGKDGAIDLSDIKSAAQSVGKAIGSKKGFHVIMVRSTVVPGTTEEVGRIIEEASGKSAQDGFGICMNPEFLREGCAVADAQNPDRIVIGADDERTRKIAQELYSHSRAPFLHANIRTAEMIKYANNAFLALCISYANEISQVCELVGGINPYVVMQGVILDRRLSGKTAIPAGIAAYLIPGCGFGGSCFPKDVSALGHFAQSVGHTPKLIRSIMEINSAQSDLAVKKAESALAGLKGKSIAVLGVAFKPDTDDIRESPSIRIIDRLLAEGASVRAYDPQALNNAKKVYGSRIAYFKTAKEALAGADGAMLITSWAEFAKLGPDEYKALLKKPFLLDCRGFYDFERYSQALDYHVIGLRKK